MTEAIHGCTLNKSQVSKELRKSFPESRKIDVDKLVSKCVVVEPAAESVKLGTKETRSRLLKVDPEKLIEHFGGANPDNLKNALGIDNRESYDERMTRLATARETGALPNFGGNIDQLQF